MEQLSADEQKIAKISYPELFKRLWPFARKYKYSFITVLVCIIGLAICSRLTPTLIGYAVNEGIKKADKSLFQTVMWSYLALEISRTFLSFSSSYLFSRFGNKVLFDIRSTLLNHTQRLPLQYFNTTPTGRIVTRITNDVAALGELFTEGIITIFIQIAILISIVVSMILISPKLTFATLISAPLFVTAAIYLSNYLRTIQREQKVRMATLNAFLAENFNGIKIIQLYNRTLRNQSKFKKLSTDVFEIGMKGIYGNSLMQPIMNAFTAVTLTAALYFGGFLTADNSIAIGSLIAFIMHAQDFIPPLREILEKYQQFQNSLTSAERVFSLLDEPTEDAEDDIDPLAVIKAGRISIHNLNFQYAPHLPLVLRDINLDIAPGESLALVGRTGSGKSTFISLLQRMYDAPKESVFIDGTPIEKFQRQKLRRWIGVVQQDNYIFKGSIAENISLNDPEVTEKTISEALELTGYTSILEKSGRTMHSVVEEKGANLSVGERQLIAFARILAFNPQILVLDEATANIDSESELMIQNATALVTEGRTSLVIAHRLSTIQKCDRIVVLDQGVIKEIGNHDQLSKAGGHYQQLIAAAQKNQTV